MAMVLLRRVYGKGTERGGSYTKRMSSVQRPSTPHVHGVHELSVDESPVWPDIARVHRGHCRRDVGWWVLEQNAARNLWRDLRASPDGGVIEAVHRTLRGALSN
jgi:hypothetical protein